jgi:energy-coupling factor transport system ATP-binding protein
VDLDVEPGQRVLLCGSSGAGKSTLLRGLAGLLGTTGAGEEEGALLVGSSDPRERTPEAPHAGLLLQDPEAQVIMSRVGDDVAFGLENLAVPRERIWPQVHDALAAVGFPYALDHPTAALSGGEKQRLALAGTLAMEPDLLLLDEPTSALDPEGAELVRSALRRVLASSDATLVLVEHRVEEVLDLVHRVVVLAPGGGVTADGPPEQVFARHGTELADAGVWVPGRPPTVHLRGTSCAEREPGLATRSPRRTDSPVPAPALRAERVVLRHPGASRPGVDGVDADVRPGRVLALVGPNGSGKSTLALGLAGLLRPERGRVQASAELAGPLRRDPARWAGPDLVRRIGTVFQDPEHQFLTGSVHDELCLGPLAAGETRAVAQRRAKALLAQLRLGHLAGANPFTLSGGEQRRLSVATALATRPSVLVLDEPSFGQDRCTWGELVSLLAELRDDGTAVLTVTHDAALVAALADEVLPLVAGHAVRRQHSVEGQRSEGGRPR